MFLIIISAALRNESRSKVHSTPGLNFRCRMCLWELLLHSLYASRVECKIALPFCKWTCEISLVDLRRLAHIIVDNRALQFSFVGDKKSTQLFAKWYRILYSVHEVHPEITKYLYLTGDTSIFLYPHQYKVLHARVFWDLKQFFTKATVSFPSEQRNSDLFAVSAYEINIHQLLVAPLPEYT